MRYILTNVITKHDRTITTTFDVPGDITTDEINAAANAVFHSDPFLRMQDKFGIEGWESHSVTVKIERENYGPPEGY